MGYLYVIFMSHADVDNYHGCKTIIQYNLYHPFGNLGKVYTTMWQLWE